MAHKTIQLLLLVFLAAQGGCYCVVSQVCYHSPQNLEDTNDIGIEFGTESIQIEGTLHSTETIVYTFLPGITAFVISSNPHHLQLWIRGEPSQVEAVRVQSVWLISLEGDIVLKVDDPEEFSAPGDYDKHHKGRPVFAANPLFEGWYRRMNSRDGWGNSRSVEIEATNHVLHIRLSRPADENLNEAIFDETVELNRYEHKGVRPLLKDVYRLTGGTRTRR